MLCFPYRCHRTRFHCDFIDAALDIGRYQLLPPFLLLRPICFSELHRWLVVGYFLQLLTPFMPSYRACGNVRNLFDHGICSLPLTFSLKHVIHFIHVIHSLAYYENLRQSLPIHKGGWHQALQYSTFVVAVNTRGLRRRRKGNPYSVLTDIRHEGVGEGTIISYYVCYTGTIITLLPWYHPPPISY